jgi:hypothetical protein
VCVCAHTHSYDLFCVIDADAQLNTNMLPVCLSVVATTDCMYIQTTSLSLRLFNVSPFLSISQVATLDANCKAVADSKYNIAELLESYVVDDDAKSGKHRARVLYLEAEQVYL